MKLQKYYQRWSRIINTLSLWLPSPNYNHNNCCKLVAKNLTSGGSFESVMWNNWERLIIEKLTNIKFPKISKAILSLNFCVIFFKITFIPKKKSSEIS